MSYNNDYSDDFQSEHYDDFSEQYSIKDAALNDLIRISKDNNIKALRQYITLHKSDLKDYKTRLLNNVIQLDGYKFVRRDGKLMIIKLAQHSGSALAASQAKSPAIIESDKEPVIKEFPKKVENVAKSKDNNFERSESERSERSAYNKKENVVSANVNSESTVNSNLLDEPETIRPHEAAKPAYELPESVNNMINSLLKQSNEQNEAQKKQYEQLANTLNESITAKNNAEQERTNRLNTVVDIIEKTFSEGTFDKIVESNTKMVEALTSKHNMDINLLQASQTQTDNDIKDLTQRVDDIAQKLAEGNDKEDSIYELEDRIQELEDTNQDLVSENKSLNLKLTQIQSIMKHHEDLLNKCINVLNNAVDESVMKQFFPELMQGATQ